ncbi:oxidoreductase [Mesorhizobium hungaricum]|jgi:predicted dehydrogenase|uniref:Oxidoreductase n=1 Tax=Mesorhizobium hungaricum TaxID=1566387 RepID=A0A1C2E3H4_9HYPH|nr:MULTISPECIES: Gfo/Idh/MocA family oxidoreductase [Mesorhizobium]MBN9235793.1 Gfo/Idh/MocA family oxidoreductase [Mesorhizobium sp.]MDQ0333113.1 putative dehydrogenase [Mesorhizobium sp. YL-MeA3-2017]OCX21456.1 oxidoreductase [Mesorhizobium hungaricum]
MKMGIIGLGRVAELHVQAMKQIDPELFAGGWNRSSSRGEEFCSQFGGMAYASVADLLEDTHVDAVLVTTSTASHLEYAKQALEAGKHVLLEKPICEKASQIRELAAIADANSRVCMPSHNYIYAETMRRLHGHIESGRLGKIVNFWAIYNKRHDASIGAPDLTMRELMIHHAYCMLYFLGRPAHVYATGTNVHFPDPAAHDQLMITAEYSDGKIANLWGSFSADDRSREPWSCYFKIIGMEGSGVIPWDVTKFGEPALPFWDDATYWDSFLHVQRYFLNECLGKRRQPLSTLADAYDAAVVLDAARQSLVEKRRIEINYQ